MDPASICMGLRQSFADAVGEMVSDNPDPYVWVQRDALGEVMRALKNTETYAFDFLESISGVDTGVHLVLVYHVFSYKHRHQLVVKVEVSYDDAVVPSLSSLWAAANWLEREQYDLFGVMFSGHPNLRRLLLPDDWQGHPLRKDYVYPTAYHGISHHRPDPLEQFKTMDSLQRQARAKKAAYDVSQADAAEHTAQDER